MAAASSSLQASQPGESKSCSQKDTSICTQFNSVRTLFNGVCTFYKMYVAFCTFNIRYTNPWHPGLYIVHTRLYDWKRVHKCINMHIHVWTMYVHVHTTTCTYHVHTMYIHVYTFKEMYIHVCTCLCFSIIVYTMSVSRSIRSEVSFQSAHVQWNTRDFALLVRCKSRERLADADWNLICSTFKSARS